MNRKVIAVDLDNVIIKTDQKVREIFAAQYSIHLQQEEIVDYEYHKALMAKGLRLDEAKRMVDSVLEQIHQLDYSQFETVEGVEEALNRIREKGLSIWVVTSRPSSCQAETIYWLRRSNIPHDDILFLEDKSVGAGDWLALIEDAGYQAQKVARAGTPVCLLDYPWNRNINVHPLIWRVYDWSATTQKVLNLADNGGQ